MINTLREYTAILLGSDTTRLNELSDEKSSLFPIAVLMHHVIQADGRISKEESAALIRFFQDEFSLEEFETFELFDAVAEIGEPLYTQLKELKGTVYMDPVVKVNIFKHLNNLIICDGSENSEYRIFEKAKAVLM